MCTVVTRWTPGRPVQILAIRDELVSRAFDDPDVLRRARDTFVVGGRDGAAGGTWCASDVRSGTTALVLNRTERHTGTPSRGVLPLAALDHGDAWPDHVDVTAMASFTLVVAGPDGVMVWTWDAQSLTRANLAPGVHMMTARGVDADDAKTVRYRGRFELVVGDANADRDRFGDEGWFGIVTNETPTDDRSALLVRHEFETDTFATVLGQLITCEPAMVRVRWSRTPWDATTWNRRSFATGATLD